MVLVVDICSMLGAIGVRVSFMADLGSIQSVRLY